MIFFIIENIININTPHYINETQIKPNVDPSFVAKMPLQKRCMKHVFPTAASPANTILYVLSGSLPFKS